MIRKKPARHLMQGGHRFSEEIMLKQKESGMKSHPALRVLAATDRHPQLDMAAAAICRADLRGEPRNGIV
jgi:hypothetical protein